MRPHTSRQQSHAQSSGAMGQTHRVTRRKSMSSTYANQLAVVAAAVKEAGTTNDNVTVTSPGNRLPTTEEKSSDATREGRHTQRRRSAINDAHSSLSVPQNGRQSMRARSRRASEGSQLLKTERRRESGTALSCETCGKAYKHSGCLTKHMFV